MSSWFVCILNLNLPILFSWNIDNSSIASISLGTLEDPSKLAGSHFACAFHMEDHLLIFQPMIIFMFYSNTFVFLIVSITGICPEYSCVYNTTYLFSKKKRTSFSGSNEKCLPIILMFKTFFFNTIIDENVYLQRILCILFLSTYKYSTNSDQYLHKNIWNCLVTWTCFDDNHSFSFDKNLVTVSDPYFGYFSRL